MMWVRFPSSAQFCPIDTSRLAGVSPDRSTNHAKSATRAYVLVDAGGALSVAGRCPSPVPSPRIATRSSRSSSLASTATHLEGPSALLVGRRRIHNGTISALGGREEHHESEPAMTFTRTHPDADAEAPHLKPLPFLPALAVFLAIGFWNRVCIYHMTPYLEDRGMHQFSAYLAGFILGLAPLLPVALVMLRQEGNDMARVRLSNRLGLRGFGWRMFVLMLFLTFVAFATTLLTSPTQSWITDLSSWFQPGDVFHPLQDPTTSFDSLIEPSVAWMGADAAGSWTWGLAIVAMFLLNIVGEEVLWRGVIWPRQQLVHGERTWLVHGFMWYLFHLPFYPWFVISGLPQAFILSYLFQKSKNTWLVLIMHTIFNSVFYVILLGIVLGFFN